MPADPARLFSKALPTSLREIFVAIVGADRVVDESASLALHSSDVWQVADHQVMLIVTPTSLDQLQAVLAAAHSHGVQVAPRGAGMGYTGSYLPATDTTISLDMRAMNRIIAIRPDDMTVTVEAGCTWAALNDALAPHGLRTPFWGPMSGIYSTIGGGLSQLNAMFGAGHYGTTSESMIALTVVLADGKVLRTGARGIDGETPFYRHFGPDLAGLFCGDSGTLGIKAEVTLRLIRKPSYEDHASFSFESGADLVSAMAEIARAGVACETCAFDPGLTRVRMARSGLASDAKVLGAVVAKQKSLGKGLMAAARIAVSGRNLVPEDAWPLHVVAEGRSKAGVADDMAMLRAIAARFSGAEVENSVAKIIRAMPFPPPNSMLGPNGEGWVPVHGHVSLSNAPAMLADIEALFARLRPDFDREGVSTGFLFTTLSTNALTIEPVFYWPDERRPIHGALMDPGHIAKLPMLKPNSAARDLVMRARAAIIGITRDYGCAHFQIGRAYPYRDSRDLTSQILLDAIKAITDPNHQLNPGGLGFAP
ncbi:FAD-binding oxidoreductase [Sphingomonas sp. 28-63-12]|uniref:FAD-binding oxidoreductase n=1 Tax=Sphingomonas sp. 28-63-12 TaxID=1970434 RepID=UPI000BC76B7B|nr:MAG: FAD-binding oxidoreductase [Sphingomonas sp. 28-63-12]